MCIRWDSASDDVACTASSAKPAADAARGWPAVASRERSWSKSAICRPHDSDQKGSSVDPKAKPTTRKEPPNTRQALQTTPGPQVASLAGIPWWARKIPCTYVTVTGFLIDARRAAALSGSWGRTPTKHTMVDTLGNRKSVFHGEYSVGCCAKSGKDIRGQIPGTQAILNNLSTLTRCQSRAAGSSIRCFHPK